MTIFYIFYNNVWINIGNKSNELLKLFAFVEMKIKLGSNKIELEFF